MKGEEQHLPDRYSALELGTKCLKAVSVSKRYIARISRNLQIKSPVWASKSLVRAVSILVSVPLPATINVPITYTRRQNMCPSPDNVSQHLSVLRDPMYTHSLMNTSALSGLVNISPSTTLTPASPPSNRPNSTSVEIPCAIHRLMYGTAIEMFSSSV
jgi:hypothetical protein